MEVPLLGTAEDEASESMVLPGERLSLLRLAGINAFQFANACWLSSYAVVTLPLESERFFPAYHDFALACFLGAAGVSQLSGPAAGLVSDHWVSRHGRRRPLMLAGTLVALPCIALQGLSREHPASWAAVGVYAASFFGSMLALNVIYAASAGLIPDLVRPDQVGQANGLMAAIMAAGACFGFVFAFAATSQAQLYVMYAALALVCIPTTLLCAQERPSKRRPGEAWTWAQLGRSYWISRAEHPAFFWLFVTRTCYYSGVSSQVFLQFYFRDCVKDHGQALKGRDPARWTAIMSFIGQVFACISAYPSARLSDRVGRKPLVAAACFGIASVYVAFCFVQELRHDLAVGGVYGFFNGAFLSVDFALALEAMPDQNDAARWMAVWGVAGFIGTTVGPVVSAPLLFLWPGSTTSEGGQVRQSPLSAYRAVLLTGAAWMLASAYFLTKIHVPNRADRAAASSRGVASDAAAAADDSCLLLEEPAVAPLAAAGVP